MTYTINQDFMDCLNAMIDCYSDLVDYFPDNKRYAGHWLALRDVRDMITDPEELEARKHIFLEK